MQKQEKGHRLPINTPADIQRYEVQGHEGNVVSENGKTYLVCTKHKTNEKGLIGATDNLEQSLTSKPILGGAKDLGGAESLLENTGGKVAAEGGLQGW